MALTRDFKVTVRERLQRDSSFREAASRDEQMGHPLLWVPSGANSGGCPIWRPSHLAASA